MLLPKPGLNHVYRKRHGRRADIVEQGGLVTCRWTHNVPLFVLYPPSSLIIISLAVCVSSPRLMYALFVCISTAESFY